MEAVMSQEMEEIIQEEKPELCKRAEKVFEKFCYTVDVPKLTEAEMKVDRKIESLSQAMNTKDCIPHLMDYYDGKVIIEKSDLYKLIKSMPKGGHLHYHLLAVADIDLLVELTKEDCVYYNSETGFKIYEGGNPASGFKQCNVLRDNWTRDGTFDEYIRNKILLNREDLKSGFSNEIWQQFQPKFSLTLNLYSYHKFFKRIIIDNLKKSAEEKVYIVEYRHLVGKIFDDLNKEVGGEQEIKLLEECNDAVPEVELRVIICAHKGLGDEHIKEQLNYYLEFHNKSKIVTGFDLVGEEDITPPLTEFKKLLKETQSEHSSMNILLHAGESHSRKNKNIQDAILLHTKRIGHGLAIANNNEVVEELIKQQICVEVCPISNLILGYCKDLRWHPGRHMFQRGVPITISADDPGYWDTIGLSLDFTYACLAWELDLKDLKQIAINGIKFSTLTDDLKSEHLRKFYEDWDAWVLATAA